MGSIERRSLQDRRHVDVGPPDGNDERRVVAERRMPQVEERSLSDADWRVNFGRQARPGTAYAVEIRDRPTNIPSRLWGDF